MPRKPSEFRHHRAHVSIPPALWERVRPQVERHGGLSMFIAHLLGRYEAEAAARPVSPGPAAAAAGGGAAAPLAASAAPGGRIPGTTGPADADAFLGG